MCKLLLVSTMSMLLDLKYHLKISCPRRPNKSASAQPLQDKALEDFPVNKLALLDPGLKFIKRQKNIGKWKGDIVV